MEGRNKNLGIGAIVCVIILVDFSTKYWAWINDVGVCNTGISFGIFHGMSGWVSSLVALSVIFLLVVALIRIQFSRIIWWGVLLVVAGGISNLVSRLYWGCVLDWSVHGTLGIWFNIADIVIDTGLVLAVLGVIINFLDNRKHG